MSAPAISAARLAEAAATLLKGGLVAMPTETVYGLAADATNDSAVARIFDAKSRPQFNPLIIHVANAQMAGRHVVMSPLAKRLAAAFWPGPLTLVLPRRADSPVSLLVSAGLDTIAVRAPNHDAAQALIAACDRPLAAPSANRSGSVSPTTADHVRASLGARIDMVLNGGPCPVGLESSIIMLDGDRAMMLRPGGLPREEIEAVLGRPLEAAPKSNAPAAPGMLASHYAPAAPLRLNATAPKTHEAFLGFGDIDANGPNGLNLSPAGNLREAAANLFAYLRQLDALCAISGLTGIAAAPIPQNGPQQQGLGEAINDRLARAAAPRP